jgi:pimeloyl-ACP methyl ester carboxylesterase
MIGALDFDQVAYVGHSVGGAASFEACRQDSQCATAVNLDGTLWTDVRPIDAHRMIVIMRDVVRSFLDVHVRDAPASTFTAAIAAYSELR